MWDPKIYEGPLKPTTSLNQLQCRSLSSCFALLTTIGVAFPVCSRAFFFSDVARGLGLCHSVLFTVLAKLPFFPKF